MRKSVFLAAALAATAVPVVYSQSEPPDISGVWKADLQKSKIPGPPPAEYLIILQSKTVEVDKKTGEKAPELDELAGIKTQRGESRATLSFLTSGRPRVSAYEGVPTRMVASWQGRTLTLNGETAGTPGRLKRVYELAPDGQSMTLDITLIGMRPGAEQHSTIVFSKQPESAGAALRQPEETAEKRFKNVKTDLKSLPASEFIDNMHYISWALGRNCEFCHVRQHFDSDDKKEKKTARDMIKMTASINSENFKEHPEVACFTCHESHNKPLSRPLFPDEAEKMQKELQERLTAGPGGPGGQPPPRPGNGEAPPARPPQ